MITALLEEDKRRRERLGRKFDPVSGEGSVGERVEVRITDYSPGAVWLPAEMLEMPEAAEVVRAGSFAALCGSDTAEGRRRVEEFTRLRVVCDFPFWAAVFVRIKRKGGGDDVPFVLNRPQRRLVERFEAMRRAGRPIRLILLKARQWGGSTCAQIYMSWLQLVHRRGLNSLIIAHQGSGSDEIKDMFDRMMTHYPASLLDIGGEAMAKGEGKAPKKMERVGQSGCIFRVSARNCKVKIGTAERPDSCRGGDYNLVHCSEVGIWKETAGKTPEMILRSACAGVLLEPLTMIVYESTANGTGNFFHREYEAARRGESQFESMFVAWHDIDQYTVALSGAEREELARRLWEGREQEGIVSDRAEPGAYLWWLWERGATLDAIAWYIKERAKYGDHALMAAEFPSDDVEAFVHSGARVFDRYQVERLRGGCRPGRRGDVTGREEQGAGALLDTRFTAMSGGSLEQWQEPEAGSVADRYVVVVDVGGRGARADWSVVTVFDRGPMATGGMPEVAAQWRGHVDIDVLAWKAASIAAYYNGALLVFESNTLETRDRANDSGQTPFIFCQLRDVYPNLYVRRGGEMTAGAGGGARYGFHTNVSTKPMVVAMLVKAVREGLYVERSRECLDELLTYERRANGSYGAIAGCHDDMLMTRAIGLHIIWQEMEPPVVGKPREKRKNRGGSFDLF